MMEFMLFATGKEYGLRALEERMSEAYPLAQRDVGNYHEGQGFLIYSGIYGQNKDDIKTVIGELPGNVDVGIRTPRDAMKAAMSMVGIEGSSNLVDRMAEASFGQEGRVMVLSAELRERIKLIKEQKERETQ